MRATIILMLLPVALAATTAQAQLPDSLHRRQVRVAVGAATGPSIWLRGTLAVNGDSTFTVVSTRGVSATYPLRELRSLDIRVGTRSGGRKGFLTGALLGGATVGLVAAAQEAGCSGYICLGAPAAFAIGFVIGAVPGGAIGWLIGRTHGIEKWERYALPH